MLSRLVKEMKREKKEQTLLEQQDWKNIYSI